MEVEEINIADIHEQVYKYLTEDLKENNLKFTLRIRNRGDRLNQGYWFSGDKNYLAFSFWKGADWRNKTPNIFFAITKEGHSSLEFVSYDDEKKIAFFSDVAEAIGMQQKTKSRTGEAFEHWVKNYRGINYIESLETFLKKDKKIIDAFIKSSGLEKEFEPIGDDDFQDNKKKIDTSRKKIKKNQSYKAEFNEVKSITLKNLRIKDISLFQGEHEISFHKNLTCIIGLNGTGKTSLLRALVLAFTGFEQNETMGKDDASLLISKLRNLLRITGIKDEQPKYTSSAFSEISYTIENNTGKKLDDIFNNKVWITSENDDPKVSDDSESDFKNIIEDRYKSLFLAFPQLQGEDSTHKENDKKYPHINDAISMLNNQPDNRFSAFTDWLRFLNNKANQEQAKGIAVPVERKLLESIFEIISKITGETITLDKITVTKEGNDPIWVKIGQESNPILLDLVSQGYNNVFGWIGYFMSRLVEVSVVGEDFRKTPATVLIDEIDTYLHPLWQSKILSILVETFPNVQFIVTTHSPYVVGSVPSDKISIYICQKQNGAVNIEEFEEFTPYGANLERLSEKIFGVNGRFVDAIRVQMQTLSSMIDKGDLTNAKAFIKESFNNIDQDDPELLRNKRLIRTKEILAQ